MKEESDRKELETKALVLFCFQKYISVLSKMGFFVKKGTVKKKNIKGDFQTTIYNDKSQTENDTDRQQCDNFQHKKHIYLLSPTFISGA